MQFTPLEAMLLSGVGALIGGLVVRLVIGGKYVTRDECHRNHQYENQTNEEIIKKVDNTKRQLNVLFRMIRRFIIHSNLGKDTQERILNDDQQDASAQDT